MGPRPRDGPPRRDYRGAVLLRPAPSLATTIPGNNHPWQRGTNENTNRLLRQYLHKNADLGRFSQDHLNSVAAKLNHRPRRVLGWSTPAEAFDRDQQTGMLAPA